MENPKKYEKLEIPTFYTVTEATPEQTKNVLKFIHQTLVNELGKEVSVAIENDALVIQYKKFEGFGDNLMYEKITIQPLFKIVNRQPIFYGFRETGKTGKFEMPLLSGTIITENTPLLKQYGGKNMEEFFNIMITYLAVSMSRMVHLKTDE